MAQLKELLEALSSYIIFDNKIFVISCTLALHCIADVKYLKSFIGPVVRQGSLIGWAERHGFELCAIFGQSSFSNWEPFALSPIWANSMSHQLQVSQTLKWAERVRGKLARLLYISLILSLPLASSASSELGFQALSQKRLLD